MDFLLFSSSEHVYRDKINASFKPPNDWLWLIACDLAEVGGDMTRFRESSVAFVLWKEQLRLSFELGHGSMEYYFTVICGQLSTIFTQVDGKVIHSTLKQALDDVQDGISFAYAIRFCHEFFQHDHQKCLSVIGNTTFQPGVDNIYPPFFKPGSTFKKVDAKTYHTTGLLNDMSDLMAYITDESTTVNMPTLENSKFAIYKDGIVVVNRQTTTIFHVNVKNSYVGILEINTGTMKTRVGYIQSSTYVKTPWFTNYDRNKPYSSTVAYLTPFTPYIRRVIDDTAVQTIPPTPPTPTIFQFDLKGMEVRESDELLSMVTKTYTATSGAIVHSVDLISNTTATTIASIYTVTSDVVGAVGQAGVWVYDGTVSIVSGAFDLAKSSVYLVAIVLAVYLISQVGPGLKEITQSSTKKRKLK
jgi:hypothetical protein